jgi:hypothetical protein
MVISQVGGGTVPYATSKSDHARSPGILSLLMQCQREYRASESPIPWFAYLDDTALMHEASMNPHRPTRDGRG